MKVAIIDDEENNRSVIKTILQCQFPLMLIVVEEGRVEKAIEKINAERPDLVFLDVNLINGTGFHVIEGLEYKPKIIFTTAFSEYALKAIKIKAFGYLLKPIDVDEFVASVKEVERKDLEEKIIAKNETKNGEDFYHYATTAGKMRVRKTDILFFEASGAYTYIVTESQKTLISKSIGEIELELKEFIFYRTHNSFIVNITKIKNINIKRGGSITLKNELIVPISQRKTKNFMELLDGHKK